MFRLALLALVLSASPALAHHPLDGLPMQTFGQGLLSGVGHPILGLDHLFFVAVAGIAAHVARAPLIGVLGYVLSMLAGCMIVASGAAFPLQEAVIALSLLVVGGLLALGRVPTPRVLIALLAGFGLFHGAAFSDGIAGQEGGASLPVLLGYLAGLAVTQAAIACIAGALTARATRMAAQLTGAMAGGVGLYLMLDMAEGVLVRALIGA
ncbi:HupE/UreJ family protein [Sulfitobacter sabulilitoris]|uniref:Hydantoin utilization protein A n=1 Tax=Sulfitobacter sabulilitoris TaxID=2562655 RepID=A0A5S3PG05_9RHOB|nr:HupE/UreJ family protein [Sulfitobacter sabulilitoris]TMM52959.1 hydantoin utilization protein A [Sulfitobacter sabulilitoris]